MIIHKLKRLFKEKTIRSIPFELFRSLLRVLNRKINQFALKYIYGIKIGAHCFIGKAIRFVYPTNIRIGNHSMLAEGVRLWSEVASGRLILESDVQVARDVVLDFSGNLTLKKGCHVSEGAIIYTHDHGRNPRSRPSASELVIEEGAWVGARAIVLPGVNRIGQNAIIGAGAVVTRDVPDNALYVCQQGRIIERECP